ncbi:MAG: N-acetylneuraminate synthase family protein [Thaumarchaeota archaeon]|nr:N-acetylneuraminate synthase family protein [Nitrososphaerota archaeon]
MKEVKIGNKIIGQKNPCFISFEPSATYDDINSAKEMIRESALAKCDAVKFQTFTPGDSDRILGKKDIKVNFFTSTGKKQELVYDALKRRELSRDAWKELVQYTHDLGLLFITAPYFVDTVDFLVELKVDAIKVSKGDINNVLLIEAIAKTTLPVILDAREKLSDLDNAIKICEKNENDQIVIMHCPSGYPAENAGVHLNAIKFLSKKYGYPTGFADHSPGGIMNYAAVALGTNMLEKTITTDKKSEHVEHFMSLELNELKSFVQNIRAIEEAMGNSNILMTSRVEETARRSLIAKTDIRKGESIGHTSIDFQRPGDAGISCSEGFRVLNKISRKDIPKGTFLQWDMLE